ncbi:curvature thylakoid 1A, chloroplastic-like protein, partial [Tanacetum coccineum]
WASAALDHECNSSADIVTFVKSARSQRSSTQSVIQQHLHDINLAGWRSPKTAWPRRQLPGSEIARIHSLLGDFSLDVKPTWLNRICDQQTKEDTRKRMGILNLKGILALSCIFSDRYPFSSDKGYNVLGSCRHVFGFSSELCAVVFTPATNSKCHPYEARRGVGGGVAVWPSPIFIGAVNSVPLLPKIMKLVGLGYFGWLVYRYLLFKDPITWIELCYSISGDGLTTAFAKVPVIMGSNGKKHSVQAPSRMVEHPTFNVTVSLDI